MSEWKKLSDLVERKICYGIVQPGNKVGNVPIIKVNNIIAGLNTVENPLSWICNPLRSVGFAIRLS